MKKHSAKEPTTAAHACYTRAVPRGSRPLVLCVNVSVRLQLETTRQRLKCACAHDSGRMCDILMQNCQSFKVVFLHSTFMCVLKKCYLRNLIHGNYDEYDC